MKPYPKTQELSRRHGKDEIAKRPNFLYNKDLKNSVFSDISCFRDESGVLDKPCALVSLFLVLFLSCGAPKPYRITNFFINKDALSDLKAKRVAVLEFKNLSSDSKAGLKLTDEFNLQLGKMGEFELVERERIQELFKEQDLDPKRIDPSTAVEIGKMLGAHGIILGTVRTYRREKVGVSIRLVSVETGRQIWEASDTISSKDKRVQQVVEKENRGRLKDKNFLASILCRLIVDTLR